MYNTTEILQTDSTIRVTWNNQTKWYDTNHYKVYYDSHRVRIFRIDTNKPVMEIWPGIVMVYE